jgi:hypothetical protein
MATNRTRRTRNRREPLVELDSDLKAFFLFGVKPERGSAAWSIYIQRHFDRAKALRETYIRYRSFLISELEKLGEKKSPFAEDFFKKKDARRPYPGPIII